MKTEISFIFVIQNDMYLWGGSLVGFLFLQETETIYVFPVKLISTDSSFWSETRIIYVFQLENRIICLDPDRNWHRLLEFPPANWI